MNIQLVIVLICLAIAVGFMARKCIATLMRRCQGDCPSCGDSVCPSCGNASKLRELKPK